MYIMLSRLPLSQIPECGMSIYYTHVCDQADTRVFKHILAHACIAIVM